MTAIEKIDLAEADNALSEGHEPPGPPERKKNDDLWSRMKAHRWHYLFVAPMVITLLLFTLWPIVASWGYGFFDWNGFGPLEDWVGLDNFIEAATDPAYWNSFGNTFWFAFASVFIQAPLALLFALVLNNPKLFGRNVYRVLIFIPVVSTTAVVGLVFAVLLDTNRGPINVALEAIGLDPVNFLGSSSTALATVIAVETWRGLGITMIYWLAALQTIPVELYDAAKIDGAGRFASFRSITIPLLMPFAIIILLLTFITSFNAFDIVQTMTAGGPNGATDIVATYIYRYAFSPEQFIPRFGYASAAALLFGVVIMALSLVQLIIVRRVRRRAAGLEGSK
ncbi:carbohydrate ABC transporter permease [Agromyces marinus]|uniref:Sugar ABC transporter permease n=1 Tax=Agromyces marinus TaxID=1389020 RepID=A0ABN6YIG4_9MICO|nr:sugar ABC transporter permease [Agromyces marinus]UIP59233.1 Melibiose/raffinose/stachyose import permease protein MelD [Agromyces marinus]BDZ55760.1 sugar ABC transporter permease [Agromyces marinus]